MTDRKTTGRRVAGQPLAPPDQDTAGMPPITTSRPNDGPRNYRRAAGSNDVGRIYAAAYGASKEEFAWKRRAEAEEAVKHFITLLDLPVGDGS